MKADEHYTKTMGPAELAQVIDHTLLTPEADREAVIRCCDEAVQYGFATVCVHGCHVGQVAALLDGHPSRPCGVVGFPFGSNHTRIKAEEARQIIGDGADELDMVVNLSAVASGDMSYIARDVEAVLEVVRAESSPRVLKVILETALFPTETKVALCRLMANMGVDFIKTSTGLHKAGGATVEDVKLMAAHRGHCQVKAAGGIRELASCLAMLEAGATRIGTSSGVAILQECTAKASDRQS